MNPVDWVRRITSNMNRWGVRSISSEPQTLVSVVVPCRNEAPFVRAFLDSVLAQELPAGAAMEVIIADGMSDDGTRDVLESYQASHASIRVVDNPRGLVSTALNLAVEASSGDVVVRMDVHTTYAKDYVQQCVATLEATGADAVGGPWQAVGQDPITRAVAAAFQSPFGMGGGRAHQPDYEGPIDTVYLGCWPRETLERLGGFDESIVRSQDAELNWRIRDAGGLVWQSPEIRSWYLPRDSYGNLFRQFAQYGYWKVLLIRKHPGSASIRQFVPATVLMVTCAALVLAPFLPEARWALAAIIGGYGAANLSAAALARPRGEGVGQLFRVSTAFVVFHVAYGYGFIRGVLDWLLGRQESAAREVWARPTRGGGGADRDRPDHVASSGHTRER